MPHMMPMMWMMIFLFSFTFIFLLSTMIYFFYLPSINKIIPLSSPNNLKKWNWMW